MEVDLLLGIYLLLGDFARQSHWWDRRSPSYAASLSCFCFTSFPGFLHAAYLPAGV